MMTLRPSTGTPRRAVRLRGVLFSGWRIAGICGVVFFFLAAAAPANEAALTYRVRVVEPEAEAFRVTIEVAHTDAAPLVFRMPAWSPGAYRIRNYAENVVGFEARDAQGHPLEVMRRDADGWEVQAAGGSVTVTYTVKGAFEAWSRSPMDSSHALIQGPSVFMYLDGARDRRCLVEFQGPEGWRVASALPRHPDGGLYVAENYDVLVDAPTLLGRFTSHAFTIEEVPFEVVFWGDVTFAVDSFLTVVRNICEYQIDFFGEIPFERYVFFYKLFSGPRGGGGLEHANSTIIGLSASRMNRDMSKAAEVTAHEFFHVWNVKRIRPKGLERLDYGQKSRTRDLWFSEGVTSYYAVLTLLRTGFWTASEFFDHLEREVERLQMTEDRKFTSLEESSWSVWERGFAPTHVSYYNKGKVVAFLLDLEIRRATNNRTSLDEVLRFMNWWFGKRDLGFASDELLWSVNSLAQVDFSDFFEKYISGTEELPYDKIVSAAGLTLDLTSEWVSHIGGVFFVGPENRVVLVEPRSPLQEAGLRRGDYLLSIDGEPVSELTQVQNVVEKKQPGDRIHLRVRRGQDELSLEVDVQRKQLVTCAIVPNQERTPAQQRLYEGWLQGNTCK